MLDFLKNIFDDNSKRIKSYQKIINQINNLELEISKLNDEELSQKTDFFKKQLKKGQSLDDILPQAFAVVREAVKRTIGERAYDVQLMSAITLHQGAISEQRTGEVKTHSVIFPAYLNALTGKGVHIVTPNDYLTRVGTGWYPQALNLLGVSTSCIVHEQSFILDPEYTDETEKIDDRLAHLRPSPAGKPIWLTLPMAPTTNLVSIIFAIIWLRTRIKSFSGRIILPLLTKLILF